VSVVITSMKNSLNLTSDMWERQELCWLKDL
jgi:hypothetical protein